MSLAKFVIVLTLVSGFTLSACSSRTVKNESQDHVPSAPSANAPAQDSQALIATLNSRIESLESKVNQLNDKLEATKTNVEVISATQVNGSKGKLTPVVSHPSDHLVDGKISATTSQSDPEAGFESDEAVQTYRKAIILYKAQKYPETILAFSSFLEQYPDHPLAGSAQYFIGRSYFNQKEFRLALQEYQKVLTSYDRSAHISDTLRDMVEAESNLHMTDSSTHHHQMLTSLFPHSPAAAPAPAPTAPVENPSASTASTNSPNTAKDTASAPTATTNSDTPATLQMTDPAKAQTGVDEPPPTAPMGSIGSKNETSETSQTPKTTKPGASGYPE